MKLLKELMEGDDKNRRALSDSKFKQHLRNMRWPMDIVRRPGGKASKEQLKAYDEQWDKVWPAFGDNDPKLMEIIYDTENMALYLLRRELKGTEDSNEKQFLKRASKDIKSSRK